MTPSSAQRGNILFIILVAVILFGALAYAMSRSNVGVAESQDEKLDTEYSKYASILNLATSEFTRLMVAGCTLSDIPSQSTMSASSNSKCNFFSVHGGRFSYATDGIPHVQLNKISIPGNGTNADDPVAVIFLPNDSLQKAVCDRINTKNGITYTIDPAATFWSANGKNFTDADGNDPSAWPAAFNSKTQGCLFDATIGNYIIFGVVTER